MFVIKVYYYSNQEGKVKYGRSNTYSFQSWNLTIKMPPFKDYSLEMSGPSSGALKDGISFKSNIGSKHTRRRLSICFCHQSVVEDDNGCGGMASAGVELYLFHIYWIFSSCEVPWSNKTLIPVEKSVLFPLFLFSPDHSQTSA